MLYTGWNADDVTDWITSCDPPGDVELARDPEDEFEVLRIVTLEGDMIAEPGCYIIRGVAGEFYPCAAQIFAQTYNPIED